MTTTAFRIYSQLSILQICSLLRGGIAERGGVRVGHRIIEINGDSVVAKSHQHIVDILANTIGSVSFGLLPNQFCALKRRSQSILCIEEARM